jgi:7TM diverse intracellular signalling
VVVGASLAHTELSATTRIVGTTSAPEQRRAAWAHHEVVSLSQLDTLPRLDTSKSAQTFDYLSTPRWYAVAIANASPSDSLLTMRLRGEFAFDAELWLGRVAADGQVFTWQRLRTTDHNLPSLSTYATWAFALPPGERAVLLYHGGSFLGAPIVSTKAHYQDFFIEHELVNHILVIVFMVFSGFFLAYNAILFFTLRDRLYLYYLLWVGCSAIHFWFLTQPLAGPLGESWPYLGSGYLMALVGSIGYISYSAYVRMFMETRRRQPRADILIRLSIAAAVVLAAVGLLASLFPSSALHNLFVTIHKLLILLMVITFLWTAVDGVLNRYPPATPFLLSIVFPAIVALVILFTLNASGGLLQLTSMFPIVYVSLMFQYLLLSLALGARIRQGEHDRDAAQAKTIALLEQHQLEIEAQNQELERRVTARTMELAQTYEQLLVTEKQAQRAVLLSGLAHEMNTPVGICVTAASNLNDRTLDVVERSRLGSLTRSELDRFAHFSSELANSLVSNLQRVSNLIDKYKSLLVEAPFGTDETKKS